MRSYELIADAFDLEPRNGEPVGALAGLEHAA
jgi:hypothetical protein